MMQGDALVLDTIDSVEISLFSPRESRSISLKVVVVVLLLLLFLVVVSVVTFCKNLQVQYVQMAHIV